MEKVGVNTFVTRQIKGSGKTYSDKLTLGKSEELPINETIKILKKYNSLNWNKELHPWKK